MCLPLQDSILRLSIKIKGFIGSPAFMLYDLTRQAISHKRACSAGKAVSGYWPQLEAER